MKFNTIYTLKFMAFFLIFILSGCLNYKESFDMKMNGKIIIPISNTSSKFSDLKGLVEYNLEDKKNKVVLEKTFLSYPSYNGDRSKVMFLENNNLFEYDFNTGSIVKILSENNIERPKYVPNSNCISYINYCKNLSSLIIYNLKTREKIKINNVGVGEYSWSNDGKSFVYNKDTSKDYTIYKYDLKSGVSKCLFEGRWPVYSSDNKYMAYFAPGSLYNKIIVRNIETGEEIKSKYSGQYFRFSPEGDKLAYTKSSGKYEEDLIIWDYKVDKIYTLIRGNRFNLGFDWG